MWERKDILGNIGNVTIVPIIASIDSLGLIILISNDDLDLKNIARFMAKNFIRKIKYLNILKFYL